MHLKALGTPEHNQSEWVVRFHEEFATEFPRLSLLVQQKILSLAGLLKNTGPQPGRPFVDTLNGSKHANMKELRVDADNGIWRVAFAFDPKRRAILLVCADKTGIPKTRFYRNLITVADSRFDRHLLGLTSEKEKQ
jgi:hypothetical protein